MIGREKFLFFGCAFSILVLHGVEIPVFKCLFALFVVISVILFVLEEGKR
jgi:hypothetical protein